MLTCLLCVALCVVLLATNLYFLRPDCLAALYDRIRACISEPLFRAAFRNRFFGAVFLEQA